MRNKVRFVGLEEEQSKTQALFLNVEDLSLHCVPLDSLRFLDTEFKLSNFELYLIEIGPDATTIQREGTQFDSLPASVTVRTEFIFDSDD